ncbi:MAG: hypothetical protein ABIO60_06875 [Aquaticitalea sp.]
MKEIIKFTIKASIALFAIGMGAKLGKDAIENLKQFKNDREQLQHENN